MNVECTIHRFRLKRKKLQETLGAASPILQDGALTAGWASASRCNAICHAREDNLLSG